MKIKDSRGVADDLSALQALLQKSALDVRTRALIEAEIRLMRAGDKGEREAAYEIDFHHGPSRNWAVIHDLRIEHEGRIAQIDQLVDRPLPRRLGLRDEALQPRSFDQRAWRVHTLLRRQADSHPVTAGAEPKAPACS